ncbi:MAG: hypothetical protein H0W69_02355 [Gemmatimonadaceae bacterium]|nr:hypothetical protein [Gemmatimonadaceae bacterium]
MYSSLPFLTDADPVTSGEGALDPLGLSPLGDRLAEEILPGLRARMSHPRFLTAMAVASAVCEGIEDSLASDHVTPAYIVFEWLLVSGFVRAPDRSLSKGTPGTFKAREAKEAGDPMCARTYLRSPGVFGFHGVYKPLARKLNIVDDDMRLSENGVALLKIWEKEQGLTGFLNGTLSPGQGKQERESLRHAVEDALKVGQTTRSQGWSGWAWLASHLAPSNARNRERVFISGLLQEGDPMRSEIFRALEGRFGVQVEESAIVNSLLKSKVSAPLRDRLLAIQRYEEVALLLEEAFDWIRLMSTHAGARAISSVEFSLKPRAVEISKLLRPTFELADSALGEVSPTLQRRLLELANSFLHVTTAEELFHALLTHHSVIQQNKQPDGKRDWFERSIDEAAFVRPQYQLADIDSPRTAWNRPYRLHSVLSFLTDLETNT